MGGEEGRRGGGGCKKITMTPPVTDKDDPCSGESIVSQRGNSASVQSSYFSLMLDSCSFVFFFFLSENVQFPLFSKHFSDCPVKNTSVSKILLYLNTRASRALQQAQNPGRIFRHTGANPGFFGGGGRIPSGASA